MKKKTCNMDERGVDTQEGAGFPEFRKGHTKKKVDR